MPVRAGRLVTIAEGSHPFPSRTRSLSPPAPTILQGKLCGTIGRCRSPRAHSLHSARSDLLRAFRYVRMSGSWATQRTASASHERGEHMLRDRYIVVGVCGGIAAYKVADLVSKLQQAGALVDVILTEHAADFVRPLTFSALSHRPVYTDLWEPTGEAAARHIELGQRADLLLVAPATANTIAKLAHGLADDMLTAVALASPAPLVLAPSMEHHMFLHAATQANLQTLAARGATIIPPEVGHLASGDVGMRRFPDTPTLLGHIRRILGRNGDLAGRRVVVTAGGTQEPIDPVRYIGNRSSGKMGYALATEARDRGATVTLISGPVALAAPYGVQLQVVETAIQMRDAVRDAIPDADVLVMSAAVADFRP